MEDNTTATRLVTPAHPPPENVAVMEGRITRSQRYVTPVPAHLNTFDDHVTDFVMSSEGPLVRSHHLKKPSSRFLHVEEESQRTSAQVLRSY